MTRKDYELIADAIKRAMPIAAICADDLPRIRQGWANTALTLARTLADENSRFDRAKFLKACGVEA